MKINEVKILKEQKLFDVFSAFIYADKEYISPVAHMVLFEIYKAADVHGTYHNNKMVKTAISENLAVNYDTVGNIVNELKKKGYLLPAMRGSYIIEHYRELSLCSDCEYRVTLDVKRS